MSLHSQTIGTSKLGIEEERGGGRSELRGEIMTDELCTLGGVGCYASD